MSRYTMAMGLSLGGFIVTKGLGSIVYRPEGNVVGFISNNPLDRKHGDTLDKG